MMIKTIAPILALSALCCTAWAAENEEKSFPTDALDGLIGEWSLVTTYTNGAVGKGTRVCQRDLGDAYIRCDSSIVFEQNNRPRRSVDYYNANTRRSIHEGVTVWEFPSSKKLIDISVSETDQEISARGFLYTGDGSFSRRISENWSIEEDEITITLKMNSLGQRAEDFPVFLEDKMTRKKSP